MELRELSAEGCEALQQVLGYLNFASGTSDASFLANVNRSYALISAESRSDETSASDGAEQPDWQILGNRLREKLQQLATQSPAFADSTQASAVLDLVLDHVIPGYREFHRDLPAHQPDNLLFGPFMFGCLCEAILSQGPPWNETDRITNDTITTLNDYIGHRPVAALETRKLEPYRHEWTRPIPLYVQEVGAAHGPYRELIERAVSWLQGTDENLLREAYFAPANLRELALDARAHDFEHPVNKRPNYHFGQWDPHCIDQRGNYHRFVVQQVTLDALLRRVDTSSRLPRDELLDEAASVLGGTILMASGICGSGPDTHDSSTTLSTLLPQIAAYRDRYYEQLLDRFGGDHANRLREEAAQLQQPLGGARQNLNAQLTRCRASQLEHVQLAKVFAGMGYPDAAARQMQSVPVASARMQCQIDCFLTLGQQAVAAGELSEAAKKLEEIMELLRRAIECGAIVDPWNILGFDANFSLFPALENSVRDHRVDELITLMDRIFELHSSVWSEAAAIDDQPLCTRISSQFEEAALWWHQFAAHEVQSVEAVSSMDTFRAARNVAEALNLWHKGGAAAGDVAFWAPHAEMFESPKSYALVIEKLLERRDHVTSMALLMHWLSRAHEFPLQSSDSSFHALTQRWLASLLYRPQAESAARSEEPDEADNSDDKPAASSGQGQNDAWSMIEKFFDYLEANADDYWNVPEFRLASSRTPQGQETGINATVDPDQTDVAHDEEDEPFSSAYEDVVYRDSTDDGVDGQLFEFEEASEDELEAESDRLMDRLAFLDGLAHLWKSAVLAWPYHADKGNADSQQQIDGRENVLRRWHTQAEMNRRGLLDLLDAVQTHTIPTPTGGHASMIQYDRRRLVKEGLLEQIISTCVETVQAGHFITAGARGEPHHDDSAKQGAPSGPHEDEQIATNILCCAIRGDLSGVRQRCQELFLLLRDKPILYVPIAKGGSPRDIVDVQIRQRMIGTLLVWLPHLGVLNESHQLIEIAREMEHNVRVGPGAVTQFDELFEAGYRALVETLVRAAAETERSIAAAGDDAPAGGQGEQSGADQTIESALVDCLEQLTESLLISWLSHSRTLRLSVLEKVRKKNWNRLVEFIKGYGADIFTQRFLNLSNLRAILHQGVDAWLEQLPDYAPEVEQWQLFQDLGGRLDRREAIEHLTVVLEAIAENYGEYRDYNSTTTQSDRGEMLYSLLDFLRLRVSYDRVVWNLRPVIVSHEILVQRGQNEAAQLWRRALNERISEEADRYQDRLAKLQEKYAMRLATVADQIGERFLGTMIVDRMRALVEPTMSQADPPAARRAFELLEEETTLLLRDPTGAGLDLPAWLVALDEQVDRVRQADPDATQSSQLHLICPPCTLSLQEVQQQLDEW